MKRRRKKNNLSKFSYIYFYLWLIFVFLFWFLCEKVVQIGKVEKMMMVHSNGSSCILHCNLKAHRISTTTTQENANKNHAYITLTRIRCSFPLISSTLWLVFCAGLFPCWVEYYTRQQQRCTMMKNWLNDSDTF